LHKPLFILALISRHPDVLQDVCPVCSDVENPNLTIFLFYCFSQRDKKMAGIDSRIIFSLTNSSEALILFLQQFTSHMLIQ
jgi:hypothetical protein